MANFSIELLDIEGRAIEPGVGGGIYNSTLPLPVPAVGDTIRLENGVWQVKRRTFEYDCDDDNVTSNSLVTLRCFPVG